MPISYVLGVLLKQPDASGPCNGSESNASNSRKQWSAMLGSDLQPCKLV